MFKFLVLPVSDQIIGEYAIVTQERSFNTLLIIVLCWHFACAILNKKKGAQNAVSVNPLVGLVMIFLSESPESKKFHTQPLM